MTEVYSFGHSKMFKKVMGLIDKINKNNQEKLIKDSTFKGEQIEVIYNLTWKIQQALLSLRNNK